MQIFAVFKTLIISVLGLLSATLIFTNEWQTDAEKSKLREYLARFEEQLQDSSPWAVLIAPLRFCSSICDQYFGTRLLSKYSFIRCARLNIVLLFSALFITGIFTKPLFNLGPAPWSFYDEIINVTNIGIQNAEKNAEVMKNPDTQKYFELFKDYMKVFDYRWAKLCYIIGFFILALICTTILGFLSMVFTRGLLREIIQFEAPIMLFAVVVFNLILVSLLVTAVISILCLYIIPPLFVLFIIALYCSFKCPTFGLIFLPIGFSITALFGWLFAPPFIKIIALIGFVPPILLSLLSLLALILRYWRDSIANVLIAFCRRSIDHPKGPHVIGFAAIGIIAAIIGLFVCFA